MEEEIKTLYQKEVWYIADLSVEKQSHSDSVDLSGLMKPELFYGKTQGAFA